MIKSMKHILLLAVVFSFALTGCNDLFDKGDTEKSYDGPDVVEFKPLQMEIPIEIQQDGTHSGAVREIDVQLISANGLATSDVSVSFSVDGSSTADPALYELSTTSVTIPSGSAAASFTITVPSDADLEIGDEFTVILNMGEVSNAEAAENLDQTTIFIQGVEAEEE